MVKNNWPRILLLAFLLLPLNSLGQSSSTETLKTITIQVGSLKEIQQAEQELARLKSHGLNAFMRHEHVRDKGMWYRIYVGKYETRNKATNFAQSLKDRKIISGFWVKQIEIPAEPLKSPQPPVGPTEKPETTVDTGQEIPKSPSMVIPVPEKIVPPATKPAPSHPPIEKPKAATPEKSIEPIPTVKKESQEIFPAQDAHEQEPESPVQGIAVQGPDNRVEDNRFSVGVKSSYFLASNTEDLKIKRPDGGDRYSWSIKNPTVYNALITSYRFKPTISIEAAIERAFFTKLDVWHLNIGPKFEFRKIGMLTPYAKGGLVIGHMEWDGAPGDFDTAWGWEGGFGVSFNTTSNMQFGLETSYRAITYDYNRPSDADVTATDNQIDFSGFALSATLRYLF